MRISADVCLRLAEEVFAADVWSTMVERSVNSVDVNATDEKVSFLFHLISRELKCTVKRHRRHSYSMKGVHKVKLKRFFKKDLSYPKDKAAISVERLKALGKKCIQFVRRRR